MQCIIFNVQKTPTISQSREQRSCPIQRTILDFPHQVEIRTKQMAPLLSFCSRRQNIGYRARKIMVSFWRGRGRGYYISRSNLSPTLLFLLHCRSVCNVSEMKACKRRTYQPRTRNNYPAVEKAPSEVHQSF